MLQHKLLFGCLGVKIDYSKLKLHEFIYYAFTKYFLETLEFVC